MSTKLSSKVQNDSYRTEYRISRKHFATSYILSFLLLIFPLFSPGIRYSGGVQLTINALSLVFAAVFLIEPDIKMRRSIYIATLKEIISVKGILEKEQVVIPYSKIRSIKILQNPLEKIMNLGDIRIRGADSEMMLVGMENPVAVHGSLKDMVERSKDSSFWKIADMHDFKNNK